MTDLRGQSPVETGMTGFSELESLIQREVRRCNEINRVASSGRERVDCDTAIHRTLNSKANRQLLTRTLGEARMRIWDQEPHLRYLLLRGESPQTVQATGLSFMQLREGAEGQPYVVRERCAQCLFSDVHQGQRKLLINEVLFMTLHGGKSTTVVYIGAAGGNHIPILCEMFPGHRFLLYDPAPFSKGLMDYMKKNRSRVSVYNELFPPAQGTSSMSDLELATSGDNSFLLISDIRRKEENVDGPTNADVDADMELQSDMCRKMNPKAAHLKCRLPYMEPGSEGDIEVKIPKGVIYFQPWCGHRSSETRLIIEPPYTDDNTVTLSARWYESALNYHNKITRYSRFSVPELAPLEAFVGSIYDACFDCTFERYTLWLYLTSSFAVPPYQNFSSIFEMVKRVLGREDERLLYG